MDVCRGLSSSSILLIALPHLKLAIESVLVLFKWRIKELSKCFIRVWALRFIAHNGVYGLAPY